MRTFYFLTCAVFMMAGSPTSYGQGMDGKGFSVGLSIMNPGGDFGDFLGSSTGVDINYASGFNYMGNRARFTMGIAINSFGETSERVSMSYDDYNRGVNEEFFFSQAGTGSAQFSDLRYTSLAFAYDVVLIKEQKFEPFVGVQMGFNLLSGSYDFEGSVPAEFGESTGISTSAIVEGDRFNVRPRLGAQYRVAGGLRVYAMYTYNRFTPNVPALTFPAHVIGVGLHYVFGDSLDF